MNYRFRHAESKLLEFCQYFKVVLLTGARQVGKSTLLRHILPKARHLVFDPVQDLELDACCCQLNARAAQQ